MATKRGTVREAIAEMAEPLPRPTADELHEAIETWRLAADISADARAEEDAARKVLVEMLRRAGLKGLVL